jgi:hypothetical protein
MGKKLRYIMFFFFIGLSSLLSQSESLSNIRSQTLKVIHPEQQIDSLLIFPESVEILRAEDQSPLDTAAYSIKGKTIYWLFPKQKLPDSIQITYRVLPYPIDQELSYLDSTQFQSKSEDGTIIGFEYNPYAREDQLIDFKGLNYNGSFSRGISFGNNQDLVLNSRFNLQLAGDLGDDIEILAAITDENIPLQPEGNTQQLREFDRIFIQLSKEDNRLIAGDYELRRPNSYFLNYFKKLQGATFSNDVKAFKSGTIASNASIAISRGKFARNIIEQQEGNQGPYKLFGNAGERFIIVLSGTEKVWIDGQLLRRGLEEDYVIDYNRGEVRFTNRRLITKDSRIIVEFEYSDQNYLRSIYALNTEFSKKKFRGYVNFYSEQDSKNSTGDLELSDIEKQILSSAGDNFLSAVVPGIDTLEEFSSFRAMYKSIDTLLECGIRDTIFIYSTNPDSARFVSRFSFVGNGNGNYILDPLQVANERVYKWVAPDPNTCQPRGDYEPVIQLTPPEQRRMLTMGGEYKFSKNTGFQAEVALSQNDQNRFSGLDKDDDVGLAAYTNFNRIFQLGKDSSAWQLETDIGYEFVQKNFQALNPYRNAEFSRDWNIAAAANGLSTESFQEQIARGGFTLIKPGLGQLRYQLSSFTRGTVYDGMRHQGRLFINSSGWEIDLIGNWLSTEGEDGSSTFLRPKGTISKTFRKLDNWKLGLYGEREKNDRMANGTDTLSSNSFYYDLFKVYLESPVNDTFNLGAQLLRRFDYAPVEFDFLQNTVATEMNVNGSWRLKRTLRLGGNITYRELEILKPSLSNQDPAQTFLGRVDLNLVLAKGAIQSNSTYEIGSGQEPKLEFDYVPVEPGQGNYIWLDSLFNNDGVIQDFEMEIAPFQDIADHIRVSTFTDEFVRTDNVALNQSLRIDPRAIWYGQKKGFKKLLAKFSTQSTLKISRKTRAAPDVSAWNPFQLDIADTSLVAITSNIRNLLFFNRSNPKYDIQLGMTDNRNKFVQTSGFESRGAAEQFLKLRWNVSKALSTTISVGQGQREVDSEFFDSKDYLIEFQKLEPQLTYLPSKQFRAILKYRYQQDENTLKESGETALQHDFSLELTYNRTATTSIRSRLSYVNINFSGEPNSPIGFAMLNGLQNGQNFLWNISLDRRLSKNVQLSLSYEGRKTGTARVVHVGRAQVAATF